MKTVIRVLYVDDEQDLLNIGRQFLEESGDFTVKTARSVPEGIRLLEQEIFDAVISDYQMPGKDGIQFLVEVRSRFGPVPFILFTGKGREEVVIQAINSGADFYLQKGGEPEAQYSELSNKVRYAVSRRRGELALRESEEKYRLLHENAGIGIGYYTPDGIVISYNLVAAAHMGGRPEDFAGKSVFDLFPKEDADRYYDRILKAAGSRESVVYEDMVPLPQGNSYFLSTFSRITGSGSDVIGIQIISQEITHLKHAEEALRCERERLAGILRGTNAGTWEWNVQTGETVFNERWAGIIGYTLDELSPVSIRTWEKVCHPDDLKVSGELLDRHFCGELDYYECEARMRHKSGDWVWVLDRGGVVTWTRDGKPLVMMGTHQDITERKRVEEQTHLLAEITANVSDSIVVTDTKFCINYINRNAERLFGYTLAELQGRTPDIFNADPFTADIQRELYETVSSGKSFTGESLNRRKDGTTFICEYRVMPLPDKMGKIAAYIGIQRDITDHKRAEETLRHALERSQRFVDANIIGVTIATPSGSVIDANDYFLNLIGYTREEFGQGRVDWRAVTPPEWIPADDRAIEELRNCGVCTPYEKQYIRRDGTRIWVLLSDTLLPGPEEHIAAFALDITERKRAEDALRESEERFSNAFHYATIGMALVSPEGRWLRANQSICDLVGYSEKELQAITFQDITHPDDLDKDLDFVRQMIAGEIRTYQMEKRYFHKSGHLIWVLLSVSLVRNNEGEPRYFISQIENITERKRAEEAIQHALLEKEVLLREIHHRVKNNLAGIISLIDLQSSYLTDPVHIAWYKDLETRIRSMALVHESLYKTKDLTRITISTYVENLTRHLSQVYKTTNKVRYRIEMEAITIPIDTAIPCGLVISEIVTNSLKYAFPDSFSCEKIRGEPCTITLFMRREGSDYVLTVADNGIGISPGIDIATTPSLGLYLIRFIIRHQLRGSLEVSSERGTSCTIRFPEPERKERMNKRANHE